MTVTVRFAPSPTGYLHIGGARTALFNYLFAKHHKGKFLLRIEDTDRQRSTDDAIRAILEGLQWLGLESDEPPVYQFARANRHAEVAHSLVQQNKAYYCYCSPEELESMRAEAAQLKKPYRYNGLWRDKDPNEAPAGTQPVVRIKAPREGSFTLHDLVQGDVTINNEELDDFVLLRADGTPTYMLSVVVDDYDMGISHVIRGDDHLTNAFRQRLIYEAMGWPVPAFAHIPLIHGSDGAKLSKRHGALGVEAYRDMGLLPEALKNYLLKLGWGHGDDEIISEAQAITWFDVGGIGRAPSRFDMTKLLHLNGHYIRQRSAESLCTLIQPLLENALKTTLSDVQSARLLKGMSGLQERAKTLLELAESAQFYIHPRPIPVSAEARTLIEAGLELSAQIINALKDISVWKQEQMEPPLRVIADHAGIKFGVIAQFLRAALTGQKNSPGLFEVMEVLGKEETLARLEDVI